MIINIICIIITLIVILLAIVICSRRKTKDIEIEYDNQCLSKEKSLLEGELANLKIEQSAILTNIANSKNNYNIFLDKLDNLKNCVAIEEQKYRDIKNENDKEQIKYDNLINQEKQAQTRIEEIGKSAGAAYDAHKDMATKAFENYCDNLSKAYDEKSIEYDELVANLEKAYANQQEKLIAEAGALQEEIRSIQEELEEMRKSRAAAQEAIQRERTVKDNLSSYCISISDTDKADIRRLEDVKITLSKPRILSMLVWSTYFQKQLKALAASILGTEKVCGIYKITNIETDECYIGQAVDISSRWSEHAKCGLGIDTPAGNKLYQAMQQYNLWNFSWELLETCSPQQLNERESYYIEMYNSVSFGYNSIKGHK